MADSLSSVLSLIHNYINASTVILPQFMYYINQYTDILTHQHTNGILTTGSGTRSRATNCQNKNNIWAATKNTFFAPFNH